MCILIPLLLKIVSTVYFLLHYKLSQSFFQLTMFNNLYQVLEMWEDGTPHENSDLLDDLDARVSGLPRLLALTNGLQEGQQRGNPQGRGDDGEGPGRRVTDVLVQVVNVRSHCRDHCGQTCSLKYTKNK